MTAIKEEAYAKINLFLDVCAKREDGFHEIKTIMHTVSLSDEITVSYTPSDKRSVRLKVVGNPYLPTDSRNLAVMAAQKYMEASCMSGNIDITLKKRIPIAAGLAGGSSDAAAVLRAINKINKRRLTDKLMLKLAAALGSDVPYCYLGKTALCFGRGEQMVRLNDTKGHFVIAIGNEHISTPMAYGALDNKFADFDGSVASDGALLYNIATDEINSGKMVSKGAFNIFESVVLPLCPVATKIKEELLSLGAVTAMMSGSGPSVFGIFSDEDTARRAAERLTLSGYSAHYAHSV